ncbi:MAG: DolP-mannose mannosyltransferase [bacterium]
MTEGARSYVDIWDVKPPFAAFELSYLVALISGRNMIFNHLMHLVIMSLMVIGTVLLIAEVLSQEFDDAGFAPLVGGLSFLVYPAVYLEPIDGLRPKTVMVFFGILSIWFLLRRGYFIGGISSVLAAFSWQLGIVFPVFNWVESRRDRSDEKAARRFLAGMLLGCFLVLAPLLYWGSLTSMVRQTVVVPAVIGEGFYPLERLLFV